MSSERAARVPFAQLGGPGLDTVQTDFSPEVKTTAQDILITRLGLVGRFTEDMTFSQKREILVDELGVEPNVAEYIYSLLWGDQGS